MAAAAIHITPIFQGCAFNLTHAREMAVSAIDAYEPECRADCVNAARTIAFSDGSAVLGGECRFPG